METVKCIADVEWNKKRIPKFMDNWSERYFLKAQSMYAKLFNSVIDLWNGDFNAIHGNVDCSEEPMYSTYNDYISDNINRAIMPFVNRKFPFMKFRAGKECEFTGKIRFIPGSYISFEIKSLKPLEEP